MDKRFWGILTAVAILLVGIYFFTNTNKAGAPSGKAGLTSHIEGKGTSGVRLTEYGDYQCPACGQYYPLVKQIVDKYKDQITFQFRNFPLYEIHPNAMAAARAAEAADLQGKFWEMHDLLYTNQQEWSQGSNVQSIFEGYAKQLGLNAQQFTNDFKSSQVNDRIQADRNEGQRLKVDSTPTFFIGDAGSANPTKITNPTSADDFSKMIEAAITKKTGKAPAAAQPATDQAAPAAAPAQ